MKTVTTTTGSSKPIPTPYESTVSARLLTIIAEAIGNEGDYRGSVEPGSIDTQGMTIIAGVFRFRLELSEGELLDWHEHTPHGTNYTRGLDFQEYEEMPF